MSLIDRYCLNFSPRSAYNCLCFVSISSLNEFEILSSRSLISATSPTKTVSRGGAADRGGTGGGEGVGGRIRRSAAFKSDRRDFNSVSRASLWLVYLN